MISKEKIEKIVGSCGVCSFSNIKENLLPCRKIKEIHEKAKSVIVFVFPYKVKEEKPLNISRYAAICDYHNVANQILTRFCQALKTEFNENSFVPFCDNSPVPEVLAAVKAGLGVRGKNGLLINETFGSFVFIGEIVTDLEIEHTNFDNTCINCGACDKACPVSLYKENCLSSITQQKKELNKREKELLKKAGCVWGCDICSEICPMNKGKEFTYIEEFIKTYRNAYNKGEDTANRPYIWRGKEIIERNHNILCSLEDKM